MNWGFQKAKRHLDLALPLALDLDQQHMLTSLAAGKKSKVNRLFDDFLSKITLQILKDLVIIFSQNLKKSKKMDTLVKSQDKRYIQKASQLVSMKEVMVVLYE